MRATLAALALATALLDARPAPAADGAALIARALPRLEHRGGPFLRHPRVVTITFAGDDEILVRSLDAFGDTITRTAWWRAVTDGLCTPSGDCVGEGRAGASVVLDEALPSAVHATALVALLERVIGQGRLGTIDDDTLLVVYPPAGVTVSDEFVSRYCGDAPRGFHRALRRPARTTPYAVVPRCGGLDDLTATASHEILEAATNPDPSHRGFALAGGSASGGFAAAGVEPVDPCGLILRNGHRVEAAGFTVQRAWSNAAAASGANPCVPAPTAAPFLALVPAAPAIRLRAPGEVARVTLTAAASADGRPWTIATIDLAVAPGAAPAVAAQLDRTQVAAGDTVTLTLTAPAQSDAKRHVLGLVSTQGDATFVWPLPVLTP